MHPFPAHPPPKGPRCRGVSCGAIKPLGGVRPAVEGGPRRGMALEGDLGGEYFWDLMAILELMIFVEIFVWDFCLGSYGDFIGIFIGILWGLLLGILWGCDDVIGI